MSPFQQTWTACWSGLVHSGWDSLRVSWFLHSWFHSTRARGWMWQAKTLKELAHAVRWSAMKSQGDKPSVPGIRKDVTEALCRLASRRPTDGFAFSRCARALPEPPVEAVGPAIEAARLIAERSYPTSDWARASLASFVGSARRNDKNALRVPRALPRSSASCYEWPATRGGVDGYLRHLGQKAEMDGLSWRSLTWHAQDSLGRFALRLAKVVLRPCTGVAEDLDEAYRAAGFLLLREERRVSGAPPRSRAEGLRAPGMKVRVVGVPDALTFIEGSWIRMSAHLLAPGHWVVSSGPDGCPGGLQYRIGTQFHSVDLSKATDGLSHDAIRVVINGLASRGLIRPADLPLAERSLGVGPATIWRYGDRETVAKRGSPMGTPLSFVVLSWVNAWASQAFDSARHHGDDCAGRSSLSDSTEQLKDYSIAVGAVGAELNHQKTFTSSSWTMCEVLSVPTKKTKSGMVVFVAPPCPPPGLKAPVAAESRCGSRYLKRQERVMKTLFPWVIKDARLRLPVEIGGLGYLGRGLNCSKGLRARLGALVSREPTVALSTKLQAKAPFREAGLYPRPWVQSVEPREYWAAKRAVASWGPFTSETGETVPLRSLVIFESMLVESELRSQKEGQIRRRRDGGRPERTKSGAVFRSLGVRPAKPLTKFGGIAALKKWADKVKALSVTVPEDIADRKSVV